MIRRVIHILLVTWQTGIVSFLSKVAVATAGGMTMHAVKDTRLDTRTHTPKGKGVVFSEVPTIRIEVGMLERVEAKVIKVFVTWNKAVSQRKHFGMARGAKIVGFLFAKCTGQNDLQVLRNSAFRCL
jgi:hypothetical protein